MKSKVNNNPDPYKKRESLAAVIFLDIRLLYLFSGSDNCLDTDCKPTRSAVTSSAEYHLVDSKVMNNFVNNLINDYRMN